MLQQGVLEARGWNSFHLDRPDKEVSIPVRQPALVEERINKAARRDSTVLISGESGTGKELVAQAIHQRSARSRGPLIHVDCTSLPDALFESLLFGHTKGAFTGADRPSCGFFRAADAGTLFLDEIGELSLGSQAKLLRSIQEKRVIPLGMHTAVAADVRIVAATHRDLWSMVGRGQFREDLFYRLHVITIHVPPLRERGEELLSLAEYFLQKMRARDGSAAQTFGSDALAALRAHTWPGNVRELANAVEYAVALSDNPAIQVSDLPETIRRGAGAAAQGDAVGTLAEIERSAVADALRTTGWHKSRAANRLGIKRQTLYRLIKRYHLSASI